MTRSEIGLRSPTCVTRRSDQEGKTVHYAGPSPWTTNRSVGKQGIDQSTPARFRDTTDHAFCAAIWRGYQAYHMDARNGCDIFYSSGTCPHGVRFEGRGPGVQHGANGTTDGNRRSTSTQYIAGDDDPLTDEAKLAFHDEAARFGKPLRWEHKDWKLTLCAGPSVGPWRRQSFPVPITLPEEDLDATEHAALLHIEDMIDQRTFQHEDQFSALDDTWRRARNADDKATELIVRVAALEVLVAQLAVGEVDIDQLKAAMQEAAEAAVKSTLGSLDDEVA